MPCWVASGVPRATFVLSVAVGLLVGLVIGSFATGWYIVPTEVAIATVRTAADEIAEEMVRLDRNSAITALRPAWLTGDAVLASQKLLL